MGLEEVRENIKDQFLTTWEQVRDSSAFMSIKEKYEILPQQTQKIIKILGLAMVALLLFMMPYGYISSSNDHMQNFEQTRMLINDLLDAQSTQADNIEAPPTLESLRASVQDELKRASLEPEQIVAVTEDTTSTQLSFKNKDIRQRGLKVELSQLNLRQIVSIGKSLQNIHNNAKLIDLQINSTSGKEQGYFNVSYFLKTFEVPGVGETDDPAKTRRPRGPRGSS